MNWYKKSNFNLSYIGNCIDTVDDMCIWDATQMAQLIENSEPIRKDKISQLFPKEFLGDISLVEAGSFEDIYWIHDLEKDIHYFFESSF